MKMKGSTDQVVDVEAQPLVDAVEKVNDAIDQLPDENRVDDAIALADEYLEWVNPESYIDESTHFYNEDELLQLYLSLPETDS